MNLSAWELYGVVICAMMMLGVNAIVIDRRLAHTRMIGLQRLVDGILVVIIVCLLVVHYSWLLGSLVALGVVGLRLMIGKIAWFRRFVQRLYRRFESRIMKATRHWHWLEWFGVTERDESPAIGSQTELRDIVTHSKLLSVREQRRFDALFESPKKISSIMVPVDQVVSVAVGEVLGPLVLDELHASGHRQFPVVDNDIDHIKGFLHLDDVVELRSHAASVREALDPRVEYALPNDRVDEVFRRCLDARCQNIVVRDDSARTIGIVTLRDLADSLIL